MFTYREIHEKCSEVYERILVDDDIDMLYIILDKPIENGELKAMVPLWLMDGTMNTRYVSISCGGYIRSLSKFRNTPKELISAQKTPLVRKNAYFSQ